MILTEKKIMPQSSCKSEQPENLYDPLDLLVERILGEFDQIIALSYLDDELKLENDAFEFSKNRKIEISNDSVQRVLNLKRLKASGSAVTIKNVGGDFPASLFNYPIDQLRQLRQQARASIRQDLIRFWLLDKTIQSKAAK